MTENEILNLINFAPNNLMEFFDNSVIIQDSQALPTFGVLKSEPISFTVLDSTLIGEKDAKSLIKEYKKE